MWSALRRKVVTFRLFNKYTYEKSDSSCLRLVHTENFSTFRYLEGGASNNKFWRKIQTPNLIRGIAHLYGVSDYITLSKPRA